ncbi:MAG: hypothetical protein ACD_50C00175G0002 [uncultured bacterium]|nr:MAG: hypothetical protein ACD_50C00175G0002 [uncultured bacterium]OGH13603.1 MAG: hypothetical protein A2687_05575 [Candidatus Levybacteria bacterium RIFCSPHIGHO2_01_FULL_38_26]
MRLVVDTSILIDYLRGGAIWQDFLTTAPRNTELFLPTIAVVELFSGKSTKKASVAKDISDLLTLFTDIELDETIARKAGELRRDIGTHIDPQDYIVAASALSIGGEVLTLNRKHFEQIPQLSVYPL